MTATYTAAPLGLADISKAVRRYQGARTVVGFQIERGPFMPSWWQRLREVHPYQILAGVVVADSGQITIETQIRAGARRRPAAAAGLRFVHQQQVHFRRTDRGENLASGTL